MAKANSLSPIGISAVKVLARLAAKKAVQARLRDQGVRLTTYPYAELMRQAAELPRQSIQSCISKRWNERSS